MKKNIIWSDSRERPATFRYLDMASLNQVHLIGYLGAEPIIRHTKKGDPIASLSIGTTYTYNNRNNEPISETTWHAVTVFGSAATVAEKYLHKGSLVFIEGRIKTAKYVDSLGTDRMSFEVITTNMQLLDRANKTAAQS